MARPRLKTRLAALALAAAALAPLGCARVAHRPEVRLEPGMSAGRVVGILPGSPYSPPEPGRLDSALSHRPYAAVTANDRWPEDPRPSLSGARRLWIPNRETQFLYFEPEPVDRVRRPWW
ncbi:MAG: hypothetical protein R3B68_13500 [Phycisphaerales bacterium]